VLNSVCVEANVKVDNTGIEMSLPVIVTHDGLLRSYLDYLRVIPESVTSLANIPVKPTSAPTRGDNWVRF
jgi:hypothetical protein